MIGGTVDGRLAIGWAAVAPPSPTQLAWRGRIEAALRVVGPALDLLLAAGDRVSRAVDRSEDDELDRLTPPSAPSRRRVGPGSPVDDR
jgi:hypothetical protein